MMAAPLSQPAPRHLFAEGQGVRHMDGRRGRVVAASPLQATVRWAGGAVDEVDQLTTDVWPAWDGWYNPAGNWIRLVDTWRCPAVHRAIPRLGDEVSR